MRTFYECPKAIKQFLAGAVMAASLTEVAQAAYTVPEHYRGNCPTGYYHLVTDPADVPANYRGRVTEYALPRNVCVRRLEDKVEDTDENFGRDDLIVINGRDIAPFQPFASGIFETWGHYEPILGHFESPTRTYTDANNPRLTGIYKDYSGLHPVFVSENAKAVLRVENGLYLFDKQTRVVNGWSRNCPEGYSTVGSSTICYSRTNALGTNQFGRIALVTIGNFTKITPDQECPLGYALAGGVGPSRGICTSVGVLFAGVEKHGIPVQKNSAHCVYGTSTMDGAACLPDLTAVHCHMDENAREFFKNHQYTLGPHVMYGPTQMLDDNVTTRVTENSQNMTTGSVALDDLRAMINLFVGDNEFIFVSPMDRGHLPIFRLHSNLSCDKVWNKGGWSMVPVPASR